MAYQSAQHTYDPNTLRRIVGLLAAVAEDLEQLRLPAVAQKTDSISAEILKLIDVHDSANLFATTSSA